MTGLVPLWAVSVVLLAAVIAANLPFVNERLFVLGPRQQVKSVAWRLLEMLVYAGAVAALGRVLESRIGQASPLRWEFVAVWLLVFLTLGFPGFIWRYLRKH
jgi:Na+-transporting NADH:ubiquinone oxidoreductase subunit NqrE